MSNKYSEAGEKLLASNFMLVLDDYPELSMLIKSFSLPYPGQTEGYAVFMDTEDGHVYKFLEKNLSRPLQAKVTFNGNSTVLYELEGVEFSNPSANADWEENKPVFVSVTMRWSSAKRL